MGQYEQYDVNCVDRICNSQTVYAIHGICICIFGWDFEGDQKTEAHPTTEIDFANGSL